MGSTLVMTSGDIAKLLNAPIDGRDDLRIERVDSFDSADASAITFIRSEKFAHRWGESGASAALIARGVKTIGHDPTTRAIIEVDDADVALTKVLTALSPDEPAKAPGIHPSAVIGPGAKIDAGAFIGPFCSIGAGASVGKGSVLISHVSLGDHVSIGSNTTLHPQVTIYSRSRVGNSVILHAGVSIGADGFGYRPDPAQGLVKLPHKGIVEIHDHVEIGAGSCVDRARFGATVIGMGTKIDNLVQIGHNCRVGKFTVICGCTGIAGSVTIGDGVQIGGNCGIGDNLTIGNGAKIAGNAALMHDVPEGQSFAGYPAMPGRDYMRMLWAMKKAAGLR